MSSRCPTEPDTQAVAPNLDMIRLVPFFCTPDVFSRSCRRHSVVRLMPADDGGNGKSYGCDVIGRRKLDPSVVTFADEMSSL